jgi:hypothetical protein
VIIDRFDVCLYYGFDVCLYYGFDDFSQKMNLYLKNSKTSFFFSFVNLSQTCFK